ncbi:hypothetical protein ZWY2020_047594 [Hordeum vulgare]|nr:hypothetical protein ZWY2020_047594 [Hordeum vulgare]
MAVDGDLGSSVGAHHCGSSYSTRAPSRSPLSEKEQDIQMMLAGVHLGTEAVTSRWSTTPRSATPTASTSLTWARHGRSSSSRQGLAGSSALLPFRAAASWIVAASSGCFAERSLSQSPRSPGAVARAPFLSICVTDPVKMGTGVQSYISYHVITKVIRLVLCSKSWISRLPRFGPDSVEQPPATTSGTTAPVYPEWPGFQGYPAMPPHGFFPPAVAAGQAHPYMWGAQRLRRRSPVNGRWVELPPSPQVRENRYSCTAGLAFDPAVSSHFYVLQFEQIFLGSYITSVNIYSSRTGAWSHRDRGMVDKVTLCFFSKFVFLCGMMYVVGNLIGNGKYEHVLLGVDIEGKVWKTIRVPYSPRIGAIGLSQGCLHYSIDSVVPFDDNNESLVSEITLWCLKDRDSKELVLKHTANTNKLMSMTGKKYGVVEIHPDCDTIFLVSSGGDTLVAYDMRHQKVGCILNLEKDSIKKFLPYVPLFQESLADVDEH